MKTIWNVETKVMNGTVTLNTETYAFTNKNVAILASEVVREKNKDLKFPVHTRIYESKLYETKEEVSILNN